MELVLIALLGAAALFWSDSLQARERVLAEARRVCQRHQVNLLDETVAVAHLSLRRDGGGQMRFMRDYRFEFTDDGDTRRNGQIRLFGRKVISVTLELADGICYDRH